MNEFSPRIINDKELKNRLEKHGITSQFEAYLLRECRLGGKKVSSMSMTKILLKCSALNKKGKKQVKDEDRQQSQLSEWRKGQYKLFAWFLAFYMFSNNVSPLSMNQNDFSIMASIFCAHSLEEIKYEMKCLTNSMSLKATWDTNRDEALKKIICKYQKEGKKIEWKAISFELFKKSEEQCFRTAKQCRQRWCNFCDPNLVRTKWTLIQSYQVLEMARDLGGRWSKIAKRLPNRRTEHMVKNHYLSMLNKWKKQNRKIKYASRGQIEDDIMKEIRHILDNSEPYESQINSNGPSKDEHCSEDLQSLISLEEIENIIKDEPQQIKLLAIQRFFFEENNAYNAMWRGSISEEKKDQMRILHHDILDRLGPLGQPILYFQDDSFEKMGSQSFSL